MYIWELHVYVTQHYMYMVTIMKVDHQKTNPEIIITIFDFFFFWWTKKIDDM